MNHDNGGQVQGSSSDNNGNDYGENRGRSGRCCHVGGELRSRRVGLFVHLGLRGALITGLLVRIHEFLISTARSSHVSFSFKAPY